MAAAWSSADATPAINSSAADAAVIINLVIIHNLRGSRVGRARVVIAPPSLRKIPFHARWGLGYLLPNPHGTLSFALDQFAVGMPAGVPQPGENHRHGDEVGRHPDR